MPVPTQENTSLSSWGNYPVVKTTVLRPERYRDLFAIEGPFIPRGLGRSYGDAALLTNGNVVISERLDRILDFEPTTGLLRAEPGLSLEAILHHFVPRGWFLPVTPGTKFATLGGCVAADVHGKNHHHEGTLGAHIEEIELILADRTVRRCSPKYDSDLFWATVGGMGLTGTISEVALRLQPIESSYIIARHYPATDLANAMSLLSEGGADDKYSVAWIDCLASGSDLGRSIVILGHHAKQNELPPKLQNAPLQLPNTRQYTVPISLPFSFVNSFSVRLFNALYYRVQSSKNGLEVMSYDSFFYPLDAIGQWNRIYGKKGFIQYQFVLPTEQAHEGLKAILERLAKSQRASFLAVLKRFGEQGKGLLSFPRAGFTLALDIAVSDEDLFPFLDQLDEMVLHYGGRVYLAKDARLNADRFKAMYPNYELFQAIKKQVDPTGLIRSDLSKRLGLGDPS